MHGCFNLANKKMSQSVQEMRKGEEMREGWRREAGVVGVWPELELLPAASSGAASSIPGGLAVWR